jgi:hypothetical protein
MGKADFLALGDWNVVCFQCGFKRKASTMERNWQGYYVCPEHNEPRQPQDFARGVPDNQIPPWVQPAPSVIYNYNNLFLGLGDGVTSFFQLGDGLYPTTITSVNVNGTPVTFTSNSTGGITTTIPPSKGSMVTASGFETML